jgi:hypothetical protein
MRYAPLCTSPSISQSQLVLADVLMFTENRIDFSANAGHSISHLESRGKRNDFLFAIW